MSSFHKAMDALREAEKELELGADWMVYADEDRP